MSELSRFKESFVESLENKVNEQTRKLSESEARYRALIELSPDNSAVIVNGKFLKIPVIQKKKS